MREARPDPATIPGGTETVFVVDDEPDVRDLIRRVLELHGYTVITTASANEALAVAEDEERQIDLLLTDLKLPDMSGRELAQRMRVSRTKMKLLYISGQADEIVTDFGIFPDGMLFLPKPFTPYGLCWKVRQVLDGVART